MDNSPDTMLHQKTIDAAKPQPKPYKLADFEGLYLQVLASGAKSWRYNHKENGKQKTKVYGRHPALSLSEARRVHIEFKSAPIKAAAPMFEAVMTDWLRIKLPTLSNIKHQLQVAHTLERHALPKIGKMPVDTIKRADLVAVVRAVEAGGTLETAHRVAGRIRAVMDYAVDIGAIESHPADGLIRVLRPRKVQKPMACVPVDEVGDLLNAIDGYPEDLTRLGLLMMAHVFVRVRELTGMRWRELVDDVWVIPADRMKLRKPHVVPLTRQTMALLEQLRAINGDSELVFQSPKAKGKPLSENTLLFALYRLGYRGHMTAHGFRSLASTVLNSESNFTPDVIERQLAHKETDAVRAAYNRAEFLPQRKDLMQWWSDWVSSHQSTT